MLRPDKIWLVGGGISEPWTYGDMAVALNSGGWGAGSNCIAALLIRITRTLALGRAIELVSPEVESTAASLSSPPREGVRDPAQVDLVTHTRHWRGRFTLTTSGTCGRPKQVTHEAQTLARGIKQAPYHSADVWGLAFNASHIGGLEVYLQALANGNTIVNLWGLPIPRAIERCQQFGVTHLSATPTFYRLLAAEHPALSQVKSVTVGGEVADESLFALLRQIFPHARLRNHYGATEHGTVLTSDGPEFALGEAVAARVVDGQLLVRKVHPSGEVEWCGTGDLVELSASNPNRFRFLGRREAEVNVGGEKVNPAEVETVLRLHPSVVDARVVGKPNSVVGRVLAAEVVCGDGVISEPDLRSYLSERLPQWKIPRLIRFVQELPTTHSGKLARHEG